MRAKEMEKMKEEMRAYKEKQRKDMIKKEQEERLRAGWMVTSFEEEVHTQLEADVVVCDLNKSLEGEHMDKFKKAMEVLKEKIQGLLNYYSSQINDDHYHSVEQ